MKYNKKTLQQVDVANKTVIVRLDFNVPIENGVITDNERITAALPTLQYLVDKNCKIVCLSHLGRIKTLVDKTSGKKSLLPVSKTLQEMMPETKIKFLKQNVGANVTQSVSELKPKEILLLENTRYNDVDDQGAVVKKESKNDPELGRFWASLGQVFINDAFGTAHRAHASNVGIAKNIGVSCVGFLIEKELNHLQKLIHNPEKPFVVVLGGAKVSDKLGVINKLLNLADNILIGGGMVNTFLKAKGYDVGSSKYEAEMLPVAKDILAKDTSNKIILAVDHLVAPEFSDVKGIRLMVDQPWNEYSSYMSLDVAKKTISLFKKYIKQAKTIFWNGPLGVFEFSNFSKATKKIAKEIVKATKKGAYSVIGGGDSAAAVNQMQISGFSFISTGGGASLTLLEGSDLPGISCINDL